ncbi:MAG: hypothetical protein RLY69_1142, partial [Verrucomicrobiota bacterium]
MKSAMLLIAATLVSANAQNARYESLRQEVTQSIARGNAWLKAQQNAEGYWSEPALPALTALALNAAVRDPNLNKNAKFPEHIEKGFTWLLAQQKEDGGIYNRGLSVYNTATSVTALTAANRSDFEP